MAELTGQGLTLAGGSTRVNTTTALVPVGSRMRDAAGNEYVYVKMLGVAFQGTPVEIFDDHTANLLAVSGRGRVGVACRTNVANDFVWVQIYGRCRIQLGMSGVSPSDAANGLTTKVDSNATIFLLGTSLTSPNGIGWVSGAPAAATSTLQYVIDGIHVATDASPGNVSAVTSATSHTGSSIGVFLNYPYIRPVDITT